MWGWLYYYYADRYFGAVWEALGFYRVGRRDTHTQPHAWFFMLLVRLPLIY